MSCRVTWQANLFDRAPIGGRMHAMSTTSPAAPSPSALADQSPDVAGIAASIGEVAYLWHIDDDTLAWSPNAGKVFNVSDAATIATGRAFARLLAADSAQTRY